ncbi:hypothetical protein ACTOJ1_000974 [Shigella flexneri]
MFVFVNKKTGKILGIEVQSNDGAEFCNSIEVSFDEYSDTPFVGSSIDEMNSVINHNPEWYDSGLKNPRHACVKLEDYEIKKLQLVN